MVQLCVQECGKRGERSRIEKSRGWRYCGAGLSSGAGQGHLALFKTPRGVGFSSVHPAPASHRRASLLRSKNHSQCSPCEERTSYWLLPCCWPWFPFRAQSDARFPLALPTTLISLLCGSTLPPSLHLSMDWPSVCTPGCQAARRTRQPIPKSISQTSENNSPQTALISVIRPMSCLKSSKATTEC